MKAHCLLCAKAARDDGFPHFAESLVKLAESISDPIPIRPDNDKEVLAQLNARRSLKDMK